MGMTGWVEDKMGKRKGKWRSMSPFGTRLNSMTDMTLIGMGKYFKMVHIKIKKCKSA